VRLPNTATAEQRIRAKRRQGDEANFADSFFEIESLEQWRQIFLQQQTAGLDYTVLVLDVNAIVGNDLGWTSLAIARDFVALSVLSYRLDQVVGSQSLGFAACSCTAMD
jgi:hypothetical protein